VKAFERKFCEQYKLSHGVAVNSGSSANLAVISAMLELDYLRPGDEVIVSALSWSTTVWPLIQHGLVPVLVDIDPNTFNIDPNEIERAISPKTRAIMPVHVYGNPCDMRSIVDICERNGFELIEDCCEALGAAYDGRAVGTFGRAGTFSFYLSHHITTLEGGVAVSPDFDFAERVRILRAHGWIRDMEDKTYYKSEYPDIDPRFLFVGLGYNLRMTELQAAIGHIQLDKLDGYVDTRRHNNEEYQKALGKYDFMRFQQQTPLGYTSCFDFAIVLDGNPKYQVRALTDYLATQNIETRPVIVGNLARQPAMERYRHRQVGDLKYATQILHYAFSIGNHHFVDDEARAYVVSKIDAALAQI
jgi:CDP-6-deoxy-D-xylo-4-hexulose-3-dehydrase